MRYDTVLGRYVKQSHHSKSGSPQLEWLLGGVIIGVVVGVGLAALVVRVIR